MPDIYYIMNQVKQLIVKPVLNDNETSSLQGKFIDVDMYEQVIDYDCDCYYYDNNGKKRALFYFRRNVIPQEYLDTAMKNFKKEARYASNKRSIASGKTGKGKVNSMIVGYYDKPRIRDKRETIRNKLVPCRTTSYTKKHKSDWENVTPLIESVNRAYSSFEPERHQEQLDMARMTPDYQINDTAFSTITVNYNWRTACHCDAGDYHNGYSVILVAEDGKDSYEGGYLGYPKFRICVDVRHGDFILKDPHQMHCNTTIQSDGPDWCRLSMVFYYRENMKKCAQQLPPNIKQSGGGSGSGSGSGNGSKEKLIDVKLPKRQLDLKLYVRPNTTDQKVIEEVLQRNTYDKPKIKFKVGASPNEKWLDLGANIGTFALLAMSRGCNVVCYEPEQDNLKLLEKNLSLNFSKNMWRIIKSGVSAEPTGSQKLYLCKTDYNKYRHTLHPVKGRKTVNIPVQNIHEALSESGCNCIKMDIEGAEIEILEALKASDYKHNGIKKLVFEYSFDVDRSIPRFLAIIETLNQAFTTVFYTKVNPNELTYDHYPPACLVYCQ